MYYKQYGNTNIKVSAIGMGGMRHDKSDIEANRLEKCAEVLLYAREKGINYWDTAPKYNDDRSEEVTGIALSQINRRDVYVSTKTNFSTLKMGCASMRDNFRRRLELSLGRLKTDYIDFYHLWCVLSLESWEKSMDAIYAFFEDARAEGLIRHIVFSSHMQGNDIGTVVDSGKFEGMLIGYNALNYRFRQSGLEAAYRNGMGVVAMNPLGGGMIPRNPRMFSYLAEGTDLTVPQAALRFVASHREITVTLAGCTTKAHVDDAVKAAENLKERPAREIVKEYEEKGVSLNDVCTGCAYCKGCPKGIPVYKYMDAYNQKILFGREDLVLNRLNTQWGTEARKAGRCIGCGYCERVCTQHLPIIERLSEIAGMGD